MAQRGIREVDCKRMLEAYFKQHPELNVALSAPVVLVDEKTNWNTLPQKFPWLSSSKLVCKPDQLFGKRGKNNLVLLNASLADAKKFVQERLGKEVTVGKTTGTLTHFLLEPFVAHEEEYYVAFRSLRDSDEIIFSTKGGIHVEENWELTKSLKVPLLQQTDKNKIVTALLSEIPSARKEALSSFIFGMYRAFVELDFAYLEVNPFAWTPKGPALLDAVARLDDTAAFQHNDWEGIEFSTPFGRSLREEEAYIADLDAQTGASLKLTVLNPQGSVWLLVAGGGASVIYTDTVADFGYGAQLGNYGEYSGDPSEEHTYLYAKTVISLLLRSSAKKKALLIGGGIANFTDVAKTFKGIVRALKEHGEALRSSNTKIFVRRGGPNYPEGLKNMKQVGEELKIPMEVNGPEMHMTGIVPRAIDWIKS